MLETIQSYENPQESAPISVLCFTASQIMRPTMMWDFAADLVEILSEAEAHRQAAVEKIRSVLGESMSLAQSSSKLRRKHLKNPHIAHEKYLTCIYYVRSMHLRHVCGERSARPDTTVLLHHFPYLEQKPRPFDRYTSTLSGEEWVQYEKEAEAMHAAFRKAMDAANDDGLSDQLYARVLEEAFGSDLIDWMSVVDGYLEQAKALVEYAAKL